MEDRQELFEILEISQALRKYYHDALWEEEKHFTWWVSLVFPYLVFVYSQSQLYAWQKVAMITFGCLFGLCLSFLGYLVIRKEGIYFRDAMEIFCRTSRALGLHESQEHVSDQKRRLALMPEYPVSESFEEARDKANKSFTRLLSSVYQPKTLGVRDCFQLIFVLSGLLFVAFCIFTWLTLGSQL
jgi:hypothetical protein